MRHEFRHHLEIMKVEVEVEWNNTVAAAFVAMVFAAILIISPWLLQPVAVVALVAAGIAFIIWK